MPALSAKPANFRYRDALDAHVADGLPNVVQLEWLYDRGDEFHRLKISPPKRTVEAPVVPFTKS
jgi:hypothetical protein